jgi:beta-galactosidase
MNELLFGAAYYPEHDPESEWPLDAALMRDAGFNVIRVGEFCWNRMQRGDGTLTLDWLERLIDLYYRHGIRTILCTPTATPPIWAVERFPDLPLVLPDGRQGLFGGRRHYTVFHEGYRELSAGIAGALAKRFGGHPGVAGWHLDNEVGSYAGVDCSAPALRAFHRHLEQKFGSVDELNRAWGLIFWNQEVERFDQIPAPTEMMAPRSPQLVLEYNRFCQAGMAEYLLLQAEAVRRHAGPQQWIVASCHENVGFVLFRLQREHRLNLLDYVEVNNYPELAPGPAQNAMRLDVQRALDRPRPFLTLEQQLGSGHSTANGLEPRARRFWAWEALSRGSRSVVWFHWRRFRTGCEWRLASVVERDRQPRSAYRSLQAFIREARRVEPILANSRIVPDVQVFLDPDSTLARDRSTEPSFWIEIQWPDAWKHRYPLWEKEVRRAVYQPLVRYGLTLDFVQAHEEWDPGKPLIVPDLDLCTDEVVAKLTRFVEDGGTLIGFPGIGDRDVHGAHLEAPPPGKLAGLFGVTLADYYPLAPGTGATYDPATGGLTAESQPAVEVTGTMRMGEVEVRVDVRAGEILQPTTAETVGRYLDGSPCVALRRLGKGCAFYLGAVPADSESAARLYACLLPQLAVRQSKLAHVRVRNETGAYEFLLNDSATAVVLEDAVEDCLSESLVTEVPAYGVLLIKRGLPAAETTCRGSPPAEAPE